MKKTFAYIAAIAACAVSCAKNEIQEPAAQEPAEVKFSAVSEGCTKTVLDADGKTVLWKKGDRVSILVKDENIAYTAKSDGVSTKFSSKESVTTDAGAAWAVYPYSERNSVSEKGVTLEVPSVHNVTSTGFAKGSNVAVAYSAELSENTELAFKNVCSYLKLTFNAEQGVNSIVLSSENKNVALAGTVTVKMDAEGLPEIAETGSAVNEVTLKSESALDGIYMIPVLPGTEAKWTLTFTKTDGTVSTTAMGSNAAAFVRNTPLAFDFSGAAINWKAAPTSLTAEKVFWSDAHISWAHEGKADSYKVYVDGKLKETVSTGEKTAHITGLENGTKYSVKVAAVYGSEEMESEPVEITTGKIRQLTRNVSPTSVAVGIENRAGALAYNMDKQLTQPCLFVELYKDGDLETPVYSTYVLDAEKISMGHPFVASLVVNEKKAIPDTRLAFGALESGTKYYFRIKSAEDYTYQSYAQKKSEMTASSKNGVSEFSAFVELETSQEHVAESNEILFQGFDDCSMEADFINTAVGLTPAFKGTQEGNATGQHKCASMFPTWDKGWCFYGLRTDIDKSDAYNCGWMSQTTTSSELFEISSVSGKPLTKPEFMASAAAADNRVGSFSKGTSANPRNFKNFDDWFLTNKCYPHEGYMALGTFYDYNNNPRTNAAKGTIVTPALAGALTETEQTCTVSFKALSVQGRAGSITVGLYRGSSPDDWTTPETIQIQNSNGTFDNAGSWSSYNDSHKWYEHSFEISLKKGDRLAFTSDGNSCICIDDIKIVLK